MQYNLYTGDIRSEKGNVHRDNHTPGFGAMFPVRCASLLTNRDNRIGGLILINYTEINQRLLRNAEHHVREWLPGGTKQGHEYLPINPTRDDANPGSFTINLKTGYWMDGATGDKGGDLISLYAYINGMKQGEAAKALSVDGEYTPQRGRPKITPVDDDGATICLPVPKDAPKTWSAMKIGEAWLSPSMIHTYKDAAGEVLRHIYRFEAGNGLSKKEFRPLTCWRDKSGKLAWRIKDIPEKRPLYGLDALAKRPDDPVLVVSGEKCADAVRAKIPEYVVITWSGGDNGTGKTDFSPLQGRKMVWWPDNDDSGKNTMRRLADKLGGRMLNIDADKYPKGWDCADAVAAGIDVQKIVGIDTAVRCPRLSQLAPKDIFVHLTEKGKILGTMDNFRALLNHYDLKIWYNEISKKQGSSIAGVYDESNDINSFYTDVKSVCNLNEFPPRDVDRFLDREAMRNRINPVTEWVSSDQWDRITRSTAICDAVECDDSITKELKETLILKWLVSAYAAVSRKDGDDFRTRGVLVFQGAQGIGKTTFLRNLCGAGWGGDVEWFGEGLTLDPENKDSILNAQKFWIVEMAELENTTKRSMPALKALLTNPSNTVRLPYAKAATTIWSRTVYAGTVNQKDVLPDITGNSRFWCLPVVSFGDVSKINMQQLWAEVKYYKEEHNKIWWLNSEEEAQLDVNNREYMASSPVDELLAEKLDWETNIMMEMWPRKTCTVILKECGMNNPSQGDARRAAYFMREKLGMGRAPRISTGGARFYPCPPLKSEADNFPVQRPVLNHYANNY